MKQQTQKQQQELVSLLLAASKDRKLFETVLVDLLTPAEYTEMATRWQIVQRLAKGEPQRTIAKDLRIGIATVTRGSRALAESGGFALMIKKLKIK